VVAPLKPLVHGESRHWQRDKGIALPQLEASGSITARARRPTIGHGWGWRRRIRAARKPQCHPQTSRQKSLT
jgi:hypothetical protein